MATKLEKPLKREITIRDQPFVVTLDPHTLKLIGKGRRKGLEIRWEELVSGEAALAAALRASIVDRSIRLGPSTNNVSRAREGTPSVAKDQGRRRRAK